VHEQVLINAKLKTGNRHQETADWEKCIKEAKVNIGLYCHLKRRKDFKGAVPPSSRLSILGPSNPSQHDGSILLQNFRTHLPCTAVSYSRRM